MRCAVVLTVVLLAAPIVDAQLETVSGSTTDAGIMADDAGPEGDSKDDASEGAKKKGPSFIPIPIFVTEPAIGYGLGAAFGYFHPTKGADGSTTTSVTSPSTRTTRRSTTSASPSRWSSTTATTR